MQLQTAKSVLYRKKCKGVVKFEAIIGQIVKRERI